MKLAIIPARRESKRLKNKNIRNFAGRPILAWPIKAALESKVFDEVMVSTEDQEIVDIAKSHGAEVPFLRPKELSGDLVGNVSVIKHILSWYKDKKINVTDVCCLYATASLVDIEDIVQGLFMLQSNRNSFVVTVCEYKYPIQRALVLNTSQELAPIWPEKMKQRSQELDKTFFDAGQFIWAKEETFMNLDKPILSSSVIPLILPSERVQDIDTAEDFYLAESKFLANERDKMISKIIIGTANFGIDYGIKNTDGKVSDIELNQIVKTMQATGIDKFDSAIDYLESHQVLGKIGIKDFKVDTKLPSLLPDVKDIDKWVNDQILQALEDLSVEKLNSIYFHNPMQLLNEDFAEKAVKAITRIKKEGLINQIGVSIYDPMIFEKLPILSEFDVIQAPLNIFDRRIIDSGWLERLHKEDIKVIARSVFLQGLLLMEGSERPDYFSKWDELLEYDNWIENMNVSRVEACMQFVFSIPQIDGVIIGVDNAHQLQEISDYLKPAILEFPDNLVSNDEGLIDPNNWIN